MKDAPNYLDPLSEAEVRESLGLRAFAAWCGTTEEHAATREMWGMRGARYTLDAWNRVADVYVSEIMALRAEIATLKEAFNERPDQEA